MSNYKKSIQQIANISWADAYYPRPHTDRGWVCLFGLRHLINNFFSPTFIYISN